MRNYGLMLDTDLGVCPECGMRSVVEHEKANISYLSCRCGYKEIVSTSESDDPTIDFDDERFSVWCKKEADRFLCTPEQLVGATLFIPDDSGNQACLRVIAYQPATRSFVLLGGLRFNAPKLVADLDAERVTATGLWRDLARDESPQSLRWDEIRS